MLWRNDNAIIVGKHQNTFAELDEDYVRRHGIRVVRRLSGGGAVYHDLGNLNYTFITDASGSGRMDFARFCLPVVRTLRSLGVAAEINGRNDMTVSGRKFSGSAQYLREGRVMHHGTLLFDSDLTVLEKALRVDEEKLRAKGVRSVRSRVTNIREHLSGDISMSAFRRTLLEQVREDNNGKAFTLTDADMAEADRLKAERYGTYAWNWGASPNATLCRRRRFDGCGTVEAYIRLERGLVAHIDFRGDFFSLDEPELLAARLAGIPHTPESYAGAVTEEAVSRTFVGLHAGELVSLLCDEEGTREGAQA